MVFLDKILKSDDVNITGLTPELKGYYIYKTYTESKNSVLFVTSNLYEANIFYQIVLNYTNKVLFFPMDDFLTSEALAISPEFLSYRLNTLNKLVEDKYIIVTNLMGYLRFLPTRKEYKNHILKVKTNDIVSIKNLTDKLYKLGYERDSIITQSGTMAVRGFILDVFPLESEKPIRIEFFDDEIESISEFDLDTQLRTKYVDEFEITPSTEFIVATETSNKEHKHYEISNYCEPDSLYTYAKEPLVFINDYNELINSYNILQEQIDNYKKENHISSNIKFMHDLEKINPSKVKYFETFGNISSKDYKAKQIDNLIWKDNKLEQFLQSKQKQKYTIIICLNNKIVARKVQDRLKELDVISTTENEIYENRINIIVKKMNSGFEINNYYVITEKELFNKKEIDYIYRNKYRIGSKIKDITKLKRGDFVVHIYYGIGIYQGIKTLNKNGLEKDYILILYKNDDKLYVPVEKIDLLSKYSSQDGHQPKLNKLGSSEWTKTKLKVRKRAQEIANDLIKLYSIRESTVGFAFKKDTEEQAIFESEFPYQETKDQLKVTEEIKKDMESIKPMDRLLCGDVGYGKTEVAFRAIFKAIMSNKQVAILCPTTLLSSQHYQNAIERFKTFPVEIAILNRFISTKKQKEIISSLKQGKIDLLIGTHRILGNDIEFKNLGLLIIDEEQRFGVKHKEKIKSYKNNIDVLTLSATPIPRTLQMAVSGIRSLSLIETPPIDRFPVQTYVLEENHYIIKDSIYKEMARGGQIFVLYNSVENMEQKAKELQRIVKEARITYVHGRMDKKEIEKVMFDFQNHLFDVLLCTTIIETGIDIPSVNTLIVIQADHFGLSQLYQIRGRVGRSNKIAYCYLMYKKGQVLTEIAKKRLSVIKEFTELGSGFAIAMRDLSIRGAGNIIGEEQSGFIETVGIDMFLDMLNDEINSIKGNKIAIKDDDQPLIDVSNSISSNYVEEEELKIEIHKKISKIDSKETLNSLRKELEDRFGRLDEKIIVYMNEQLFEKKAKKLNIKNIKQNKNDITITLPKEYNEILDGDRLFVDVLSLNRNFKFSMKLGKIIIDLPLKNLDKHYIYYLIDLLNIIEESINIEY